MIRPLALVLYKGVVNFRRRNTLLPAPPAPRVNTGFRGVFDVSPCVSRNAQLVAGFINVLIMSCPRSRRSTCYFGTHPKHRTNHAGSPGGGADWQAGAGGCARATPLSSVAVEAVCDPSCDGSDVLLEPAFPWRLLLRAWLGLGLGSGLGLGLDLGLGYRRGHRC